MKRKISALTHELDALKLEYEFRRREGGQLLSTSTPIMAFKGKRQSLEASIELYCSLRIQKRILVFCLDL